MKEVFIINGPNLNLLGKRDTSIYGDLPFDVYFLELKAKYKDQVKLHYFQSNHEGFLIDKLQEIGFTADGIIINPGGYTHTSIALGDCIRAITTPCIEVHISNIYERESFRHHSYIKDPCQTSIIGKGLDGYSEAINTLLTL